MIAARTLARLARFAAIVVLITPVVLLAQPERSSLTGRVTDSSGGALPGVTVTLASPRLERPMTATTDGTGQYAFAAVPPDTYDISFELPGFETKTTSGIALLSGESMIADRQLDLASLEETVQVVAEAPPPPPPAPVVPPPPIRTRPRPQPLPKEVLASVCGPNQPGDGTLTVGRITAHRDDRKRELYGSGDILLLDVGADHGISTGQNFVVRRRFRIGDKSLPLKQASFGEQAAGLVQVVETEASTAVAVVVYVCSEFYAGDTIEPFDALPMWTAQVDGTPQFDAPARIVFGDHGQVTAGPRQLMVIDWGAMHGVQRGQRLTVFRKTDKGPVSAIADATIVAVRAESATIRIERASDAVTVGDMVALHR